MHIHMHIHMHIYICIHIYVYIYIYIYIHTYAGPPEGDPRASRGPADPIAMSTRGIIITLSSLLLSLLIVV